MTSRIAGDVFLINSSIQAAPPTATTTTVDTTTSGGVTLISVNCTGAQEFAVTNSGSINVYIMGSFNGVFFQPSIAVTRVGGVSAGASTVDVLSASTIAIFRGPYQAVRMVANSGSGVYRAALLYR